MYKRYAQNEVLPSFKMQLCCNRDIMNEITNKRYAVILSENVLVVVASVKRPQVKSTMQNCWCICNDSVSDKG